MKRITILYFLCFIYTQTHAFLLDQNAVRILNYLKMITLTVDGECKKNKKNKPLIYECYAGVLKAYNKASTEDDIKTPCFDEQDDFEYAINNAALVKSYVQPCITRINKAITLDNLNDAVFGRDTKYEINTLSKASEIHYPEAVTQVSGEFTITSIAKNKKINEGSLVNVIYMLDRISTEKVISAAQAVIASTPELNSLGLAPGRNAHKPETGERYVTLALNIKWNPELKQYIDWLNTGYKKDRTFKTKGELKLVVPEQIKSGLSVVTQFDDFSIAVFNNCMQHLKSSFHGYRKVPSLHLTQANIPIETNQAELDKFLSHPVCLNELREFLKKRNLTFRRE